MSEEIPPQLIKETQTLLGKYIKEPPLTDKLLKKPPFRFLQDIVKSVAKETGFLGDVYSAEELSENIKDKEKKVAFLKKLISATQDATGTTIAARPSKIVAGLEVSKTLELLQSVAAGVALKQSGAVVKHSAIEGKKDKKKSKDKEAVKDTTKKSKSKKEGDGSKEESAKEKKKKKDKDVEEADSVIVNGDKKRDKSAKEAGEGKKRDKSAKDGSSEKKKREKSARDEESEDKKRKKSAKDEESGDKKKEQSTKENGVDKRDKSAKKEKPKERPPSRRPSFDAASDGGKENGDSPGAAATLATVPMVNGVGESHGGDGKEDVVPIPANILDEAKENAEPSLQNAPRKLSIDASKEKPDKENREKRDKRDRSKEGSAVERKTSSRRSSSKVRPSSKNAEKSEKAPKEKKLEEEPTVLGSGEAPVTVPQLERPQTARKPPPSARPQSMRPPSARPGAPKIRDRGEVKTEIIEPEAEVKVVPVITDSEQTHDDENTVTVERQTLSPDLDQGDNFIDAVNKVGDNEGALVAQILETKKELEDAGQLIGGESQRNVEIEWEGGKKQKKEAWGREINKLREGIQQLTRSTNPLGKLFDFLQEDVDSMQRELKTWKETNASYSKQLQNERKMTENSLETYRRQLSELDSLIEQEAETLKNMKANVLANDRKIYSLITKTSTE